ncbi:MerR family transcriptional regulator [Saccharibacillus sacchari]|uniref:MerR family transcriptional regulator n=1 Tax=Saccharibacillus sacchari TaxID=456493 RepID=A0ACC6PHJ3_9BACL
MSYTIGQVAKKMNVSTFALRYYDREGLLPFVKRSANGVRLFEESDLEFLRVIDCLKNTGMSIGEIRSFIEWTKEGDASLGQRLALFEERKKAVDLQIAQLLLYKECIEFKHNYYTEAVKAKTEAVHRDPNAPEADMVLGRIVDRTESEQKNINKEELK